jgi:four helix bundle protein
MIDDLRLLIDDWINNRQLSINNRKLGGGMSPEEFKRRTKLLAVRVIRLVSVLPDNSVGQVMDKQLLRSASSIGANYRAASRAKSPADMVNKLKIVEEEADETLYWLELLIEAEVMSEARLADLITETNEILAMTVASIKTLRAKQK